MIALYLKTDFKVHISMIKYDAKNEWMEMKKTMNDNITFIIVHTTCNNINDSNHLKSFAQYLY